MTAGTEPLVTAEMLRDFVDRLKARGDLDAHPLVKLLAPLPEFGRYVGAKNGASLVGEQIARALRAIWRQRFMPHVLNAERLVKWNAFFILEVMYFYPHAKGMPFPDTLKDAAVLLCDAEHLALIIADGDAELAATLFEDNPEFWARLIPASMTPAEQTLHSRRNASLGKLTRELNAQLAKARSTSRQGEVVLTVEPAGAVHDLMNKELEIPRQSDVPAPRSVLFSKEHAPVEEADESLSPNARRMLEALGRIP